MLPVIDFDSLIHFQSAAFFDSQDYAVHIDDLRKTVVSGVKWESVYRFLFWQVLWIAFTWWHPEVPDDPKAKYFVGGFLSNDKFSSFKAWLKPTVVSKLTELNRGEITAETIDQLLETLSNAPWQSARDNDVQPAVPEYLALRPI